METWKLIALVLPLVVWIAIVMFGSKVDKKIADLNKQAGNLDKS